MSAWKMGAAALAAGTVVLGASRIVRLPPDPAPRDGVAVGGAVVAYSPGYRVSFFGIERLHPFDIAKYDKIAQHLVEEGLVGEDDFFIPQTPTVEQLGAVHDPDYLASLRDAKRLSAAIEVALPGFLPGWVLERRVLRPFRRAVGGTLVAARGALEHGLGINLGGGYHHARPALGHGFCIYNDVAYAVHTLRQEGFAAPVLIVDTDAHQGDGNHAFFAQDDSVFSLSLHQGDIFPSPKLRGDQDVPLRGGTGDDAFLAALEGALQPRLESVKPGLVVHVAGSDILSDDPLADLAVTPDGLVARDQLVQRLAAEHGVPLLYVLAGGYGPSSATAQGRSVAEMLRQHRQR